MIRLSFRYAGRRCRCRCGAPRTRRFRRSARSPGGRSARAP
ncbi:Arm DNA-binding domain-containing protein [Rhizobium metallidurans]